MEEFDTDAVGLISDPYRETAAFGAEIIFPEDSVPQCIESIIKTSDDIKRLKIPDVLKSERTLDRIKAAKELRRRLGNRVPIIGWIEGPLAEACDLVGFTEMLMKLMLDEEFTRLILERTAETARIFAKVQIEAGCDIIGIGDSACSQISPDVFEKYEKFLLKEIIDYIHLQNALVKLHICGNITHLLTHIKDIKPDIVDIDWMVDMEEAYRILGPDIIRCGNIDPAGVIEQSTPEDVLKKTEELCQREKGRKFILSGGCEITVKTPVENLKAMREATRL